MASLYRKYRSRSFDDLVGQDHVVRTLRNAVRQHRVGHAYLFTGPRGTGKTSTARILAKAVNCLHPTDGNPDNECEHCRAANEGRAMDVVEIDAASNTSVDNVRDLRERVGYASSEGSYKVYIVDEVHRLSAAAFDAFLKTLEEPPPHVIFVFASTEPHKVPETITSRCQRFDFHRISQEEMFRRLVYVSRAEGLEGEDDALRLISQHARGSLRDALGLLDQVAAYTSGTIRVSDVRTALGLADPELVGTLTDQLCDQTVGAGLEQFHAFVDAGGDPGQLMTQCVEYWRALLLTASGAQGAAAMVDPALTDRVALHARRLTPASVVQLIKAMTDPEFSARFNIPPELSFEMRYVRAGLVLAPPGPDSVATGTQVTNPSSRPVAAERPPDVPRSTAGDVPSRELPAVHRNGSEPARAPSDPVPAVGGQEHEAPPVAAGESVETAWTSIIQRMRARNPSIQAVLRSGYLLRADQGELVIGFEYDFHFNYFSDTKKRKLVEEVVEEVLGVAYRVRCIRTTKEEVERARGVRAIPEDDGFIQEAAERLRAYHARELGNGHS